jgi:sulfite reductase (NADPH) hemoprotein beta-component
MSEATNGTRKAITANRLWDGAVVYLADGGTWRESLAGCRLATGEEECKAMEAVARWAVQASIVVSPYVIEVEAGVSPRPARLRESIRAVGPTVRADLERAV